MPNVDTTVKNVKAHRHNRSITIDANFQSLHCNWKSSSLLHLSVRYRSSLRISLSSDLPGYICMDVSSTLTLVKCGVLLDLKSSSRSSTLANRLFDDLSRNSKSRMFAFCISFFREISLPGLFILSIHANHSHIPIFTCNNKTIRKSSINSLDCN